MYAPVPPRGCFKPFPAPGLIPACAPPLLLPPPPPQEGHCKPGEVLFGTDSHTCNAGAFGQFATGVGNTDAGFILGTGKLLIKVCVGGGGDCQCDSCFQQCAASPRKACHSQGLRD